jgi:hypothetical protein
MRSVAAALTAHELRRLADYLRRAAGRLRPKLKLARRTQRKARSRTLASVSISGSAPLIQINVAYSGQATLAR